MAVDRHDGILAVTGSTQPYEQLIRLQPNGAIDEGFRVLLELNEGLPRLEALVVQDDGRIVIGGTLDP